MVQTATEHFYRTGEANVKDWGAQGDGDTDDTSAIEQAIQHVTNSPTGGVVFLPPGVFRVSKRLLIETTKPFVLRGAAPNVSQLVWPASCEASEGIEVKAMGTITRLTHLGSVAVERLSLLCDIGREARNSGLLIDGEAQMDDRTHKLNGRPYQRFRVADVAISGRWQHGLVLRSAHLCSINNLNIIGQGEVHGCHSGILMDGIGSPTDHSITDCRVYKWKTGLHISSDPPKGRYEGLKVNNCNFLNVDCGIHAESILELNCIQNHINCRKVGIDIVDGDQCIFMANLIYHGEGEEGRGIRITGQPESKQSTSHCVNGNVFVAVRGSKHLTGVEIDGKVNTAVVTSNVCAHAEHAVGSLEACTESPALKNVFCAGNVMLFGQGTYNLPKSGCIIDPTSDPDQN